MTSDDAPARRPVRPAFIPAGILIGLGIGILLNYPGPGVLIGLGTGFLASSFGHREEAGPEAAASRGSGLAGQNGVLLLIGIFMILIGLGLVWAPFLIWPYFIAGFFVLLGIGFVVRGIGR